MSYPSLQCFLQPLFAYRVKCSFYPRAFMIWFLSVPSHFSNTVPFPRIVSQIISNSSRTLKRVISQLPLSGISPNCHLPGQCQFLFYDLVQELPLLWSFPDGITRNSCSCLLFPFPIPCMHDLTCDVVFWIVCLSFSGIPPWSGNLAILVVFVCPVTSKGLGLQ